MPDVFESTTNLKSISPEGASYDIPTASEIERAFAETSQRAEQSRARGRQIVVVQGLGFVGSAVAAVLSGARRSDGEPAFFVIGTDLPTPGAYWKIARINAGEFPVAASDPELTSLVSDGVHKFQNLCATASESAYSIADVIVVDVPLDAFEIDSKEPSITVRLHPFELAIETIGRQMKPDALILLETTVPVGTSERLVLPTLTRIRMRRGINEPVLLAHAYERVMPGPNYAESVRSIWRSFAGIDARSTNAARAFMERFVHTDSFPVWQLPDTTSSELAKLLENSYRAANIAFIHEWTLLAERIGVNLFEIVNSIRVRKGTHDNMRFPGFGVGGYCLTKDGLLAQWGADNFFHAGVNLSVTLESLRINRQMPLHTFELAAELAGGSLTGKRVAIAGVSYLADVPDTRNSPTEALYDELIKTGATVSLHDPYLSVWPERPRARLVANFASLLQEQDVLVLAVPHNSYHDALSDLGIDCRPGLTAIVDAQNVLTDAAAQRLHEQGIRIAGVGKGHWRKAGYHQ